MSIDRWMDKEVVARIHNGVLLSHVKEHTWDSSNELDEPGACYTQWSQKEKHKSPILMHIYGI